MMRKSPVEATSWAIEFDGRSDRILAYPVERRTDAKGCGFSVLKGLGGGLVSYDT